MVALLLRCRARARPRARCVVHRRLHRGRLAVRAASPRCRAALRLGLAALYRSRLARRLRLLIRHGCHGRRSGVARRLV